MHLQYNSIQQLKPNKNVSTTHLNVSIYFSKIMFFIWKIK